MPMGWRLRASNGRQGAGCESKDPRDREHDAGGDQEPVDDGGIDRDAASGTAVKAGHPDPDQPDRDEEDQGVEGERGADIAANERGGRPGEAAPRAGTR